MPPIDLPPEAPSAPSVIEQKSAVANTLIAPRYDEKLKVCDDVVGQNTKYRSDRLSGPNVISPEFEVVARILRATSEESRDPIGTGFLERRAALRKDAVVTVVQGPRHGKLLPVKKGESSAYFYLANRGYFGKDKAVFSVKFSDGRIVLLEREISVISIWPEMRPCSTSPNEYQTMRNDDWDELKGQWDEDGRW